MTREHNQTNTSDRSKEQSPVFARELLYSTLSSIKHAMKKNGNERRIDLNPAATTTMKMGNEINRTRVYSKYERASELVLLGEYESAIESDQVRECLMRRINASDDGYDGDDEFGVFVAGVAALMMHVRVNVTGPPVRHVDVSDDVSDDFLSEFLRKVRGAKNDEGDRFESGEESGRNKGKMLIDTLAVDGEDVSGVVQHPKYLCLAVWCFMLSDDRCSDDVKFMDDCDVGSSSVTKCAKILETYNLEKKQNEKERYYGADFYIVRDWFAARTALAHQRVLFGRTLSLRRLCLGYFARAIEALSRRRKTLENRTTTPTTTTTREDEEDDEDRLVTDARYLSGACLVEASLMEHEFGADESARFLLKRAKDELGVTIEKTGLLGYRTIHQQDAKAQLVLRVACEERASAESDDDAATDDDVEEEDDDIIKVDNELVESTTTQSAAMSRLRIELEGLSADGNQILTNPKFEHATDSNDPSISAPLSTIVQVILLAECVAVRKKQADDGLRNWEMSPYLERVLMQQKSRPIVRACATVLVTRHEKTRTRTRERALLSLEDITRSVSEIPSDVSKQMKKNKNKQQQQNSVLSKVAKQRLRFAFSVWFPPIHALKRELGEQLISVGMVGAALKLFEEIEHWDAYVSCLELLGKKQQAADVVKKRLGDDPSNAKLWCALGDATGDETCYHKAWEVSEERNARSQRSLARLCASRGDYATADIHWTRALTLNPLFPDAWFNCGYCRMKCGEGREDDALAAFVRCAQIDPENGQAWNNVAALSMHKRRFQAARAALQEAVKHYRSSWHTWENLAIASAKTGRFVASARALMKVIELTDGARVHIPTISTLLDMCEEGRKLGPEKCEWMRDAEKWEREENAKQDATLLSLNDDDDDDDDDWNDAACGDAAADIASFFSDISINDDNDDGEKSIYTNKFTVRDEEIDEQSGAPRIVLKIEEILELILAKAASGNSSSSSSAGNNGTAPRAMHDTAAIWHLVSRHAENCGDFVSSIDAKLKVLRALDASGWRKDSLAYDAYVSAAINWAKSMRMQQMREKIPVNSAATTKKAFASARLLLRGAVKIGENEGFDERVTFLTLKQTLFEIEEIEKNLI